MTDPDIAKDTSMKGRLSWLWREGLARRVIAEKGGRRAVDLPLTVFLIAAVLAPWLVALGGIAGILLGYQFHVEREEDASIDAGVEQAEDDMTGGDSPAV